MRGATVNVAALVAVPPGVVTAIGPVVAPAGTMAFTLDGEIQSNVATMPLNFTPVTVSSCVPVIVTSAPTAPASGENDVTVGVSQKSLMLAAVPRGVVTVMRPLDAAPG